MLAAERLGLEPKECAVFEDILPAVKGALSAGMKVFAVEEHTVSEEENHKSKKLYMNT